MTPTEHLERWIEAADKPEGWAYPCRDCDGTLVQDAIGDWRCPKCGDYWNGQYLAGIADGAAMAARIIRQEAGEQP